MKLNDKQASDAATLGKVLILTISIYVSHRVFVFNVKSLKSPNKTWFNLTTSVMRDNVWNL